MAVPPDEQDVPHPADGATPNVLRLARAKNGKKSHLAPPDGLPVIRLSSRLHETVDACVALLRADPEIFQRDARLVRVVRVAEADAERELMSVGTPQIRVLPLATLRERLTRLARFEKFDKRENKWVPAIPNDMVVSAIDARAHWPGVRPLVGVIETPSMRPDGTLLDAAGYDPATGYLFAPVRTYPPVPKTPTHHDAQAALRKLAEPWKDFPFSSEADRYVPVAALLTIVARPAIRGACPAFVADASTRGSGKTLIKRAITTLAQGREGALMSWPHDAAELEKVLGAYALRAASVCCFDNVSAEFGGAPLDKVLTCADRVELRVLSKSEVPAVAWRAVILAGGNNIVIGGDTSRRVLVCRLEPMTEKPEERTNYSIADLMAWCTDQHPQMVAAALTLLRAFVVAGLPSQGLPGWGSFEAWRNLIGSAIVWADGPDVMACRPTLAGKDDTVTSALRTLLPELQSFAPTGTTIAAMLQKLYTRERMRNEAQPDFRDALREALELLAPPKPGFPPNAQRLGFAFRKLRKRVVDGRRLAEASERDTSNVVKWVVQEVGP